MLLEFRKDEGRNECKNSGIIFSFLVIGDENKSGRKNLISHDFISLRKV